MRILFGFHNTNLQNKFSLELNSMEVREPRQRVEISGDVTLQEQNQLKLLIKPNLADHTLVSGPRYDMRHIALSLCNNPGWYPSGILVGFIGPSAYKLKKFQNKNFLRTYEIKGKFGLASRNFRDDGKVMAKSTYKHVTKDSFNRVISKIDAAQRMSMFKVAGVDIRSEEAYKMATTGFAPPGDRKSIPIIYGIEATLFEPPDFKIRVKCINENEYFLAELINEIGLAIKTTAMCCGIRLTNLGPFTINDALLQKHWTLENLIENIYHCNKLIEL